MTQAVRGPVGFLYLLTFAVTFAFGNLEGTFTAYLEAALPLSITASPSPAASSPISAF